METSSPNHYATLGLHRACTKDDIRTAYRILSKLHHPDVNAVSTEAIAFTQAINEAYRVLGNETRRRDYDTELEQAEKAHRDQSSRSTIPPIKQDVLLSIQDLFRGTTLNVQIRDPAFPSGDESYPLEIPSDTAPGTRFRIKRSASFASGWINVKVKMRPDRFFKAKGSDLRCDLKITARRATAGGSESIRGASGNYLSVSIPAQVPRGAIVRLPGEGLPKPRGGRGDLLVRIMYRPEVRITRANATPSKSFGRRRLLS